jgi:[ribosomal protein S5]-alanine N-acetyltransferase
MNLTDLVITTNRLKIIPISEKYLHDMFKECTREVAKYLSFDPSGKIEYMVKYIQLSQIKMQNGEEIPVHITNKITGEFIGCSGVHKINTDNPELGIWIKKSAQRKGFGKETIGALIDWAQKHLQFTYLVYPVAKENIPSRKLIESLGGIQKAEKIFTSPTGKVLDEVEYWVYKK